jgi:hypothetical protein
VSGILQLVRAVVENETAAVRSSLFGVVSAVFTHESADDDNNLEVNVRLKHEDVELRRVPVMVGSIGTAAIPAVGDLVLVQFVGGDLNQPIVAGRFYHTDARPPLFKEDELIFEHRVASDSTINQLRFAADGSIFLQRDVTKPADNSEAKAGITLDGATGDIEIKAGTKTTIVLKNDGALQILAGGDVTLDAGSNNLDFKCTKLTVEGDLMVKGSAGSTTISGNEIKGA